MSNDMIEEAIVEAFGERCPKVQPGCPCCDVWAQYDALVALQERVEGAEKALSKAEAALLPLSNAVFNDNGDITVERPSPDYEECVAAYFAVRAIRAARTKAGEPHV